MPAIGTKPWTPHDVGTIVWYDAADLSTIVDTTTPGKVEQLNDKSGSGLHLTQATESKKPATGTRTLNGLNVLDFDGGDDALEGDSFAGVINPALTNVVVFHVVVPDAFDRDCIMMVSEAPEDGFGSPSAMEMFTGYLLGENRAYFVQSGSETGAGFISNGVASVGVPQLWTTHFNRDGSGTPVGVELSIDGNLPDDTYPNLSGNNPSSYFRVGNVTDGSGTRGFDGRLAELIVIPFTSYDVVRKVEGYLAHKWGLVANLPEYHPYKNFPVIDSSLQPVEETDWTPADSRDIVLWYDADDADTLWEDEAGTVPATSAVGQWTDKSGNGNHAVQSNGTFKPTYNSVTKEVSFDGISDIMQILNDALNGLQDFYVAVVGRFDAYSENNNCFIGYDGKGTNNVGWMVRDKDTDVTFTRRGTGGLDDPTYAADDDNLIDFMQFVVRRVDPAPAGSDPIVYINHNGTFRAQLVDSGAIAYAGTNRSGLGGTFGADNWTSPQFFLKGHIKEIIVKKNPSYANDRQRVEGYLAWKWGLEAKLPTFHSAWEGAIKTSEKIWTPKEIHTAAWYDAADPDTVIQPLVAQEGVLDLAANGGINPHTGNPWKAGDKYRLSFLSSTTRDATSSDVADYNTHVQAAAAAAGLGSVNWKAFVSTPTVAARVNTETTDEDVDTAILNMNSEIVAQHVKGVFNSGSITAAADGGPGLVTLTSVDHGLKNGDYVFITGTTDYNGPPRPVSNVTVDTFDIADTFTTSQTGTWIGVVINHINYDENGVGPNLPDLPVTVPFYQFTPAWTGCDQIGEPNPGKEVGTASVSFGIGEAEKQYQFRRGDSASVTEQMYITAVSEVLTVQALPGVSQWDDKSGNDRHLTQATTAKRPVSGVRTIRGLNALDFVNAVSSGMRWEQPGVSMGDYHELYFVIDKDGLDSTRTLFHISEVGQAWYMDDYAYGGYGYRGTVNPSGGGAQFGTIREQIDQVMLGYNGVGYYKYVNGEQVGVTSNTPGTLPVNRISIGMNGFSGNSFDGLIGEVVIVPPQTTEGRQLIEGYLAWKWGFPHQLPDTHPYKRRPPMI